MTPHPAVRNVSPPDTLESLPGWEGLSRKAQISLEKAFRNFIANRNQFNKTRIYLALYLLEMQETMRPAKGMFDTLLKRENLSRSTAKKAIKGIQQALSYFKGDMEILLLAAERNMDMIGDGKNLPIGTFTTPTKNLPPPDPTAPIEAKIIYLDDAKQVTKKYKSREERLKRAGKKMQEPRDPRKWSRDCYQLTMKAVSDLPFSNTNRQTKARQIAFVEEFVGMVLTELGVSSPKMIEPQAVPEDFPARPVGRPAVKREESEEE
jgi:hypothetical protein